MSTTLDLINAIEAGDSINIQNHFDYLMTERIAAKLDDMRTNVAKNMFKENVEVVDEEFEDLTTEELEEFMQTEEFEQLDEISKNTLRSYMDKSVQSYSDTGTKLRVKLQAGEEDPALRKKIQNRLKGQMTAYNKMRKEEYESLAEAITPQAAKEILHQHDAHDKDFFTLSHDQVSGLHSAAKKLKYRAHKNAPGSTARMFHQHLQRLAKKA